MQDDFNKGVEAIEVDGDFVVWAQNLALGGSIRALYGAEVRTLAENEASVCALALDPGFVYWINCKKDGFVKRVAR